MTFLIKALLHNAVLSPRKKDCFWCWVWCLLNLCLCQLILPGNRKEILSLSYMTCGCKGSWLEACLQRVELIKPRLLPEEKKNSLKYSHYVFFPKLESTLNLHRISDRKMLEYVSEIRLSTFITLWVLEILQKHFQ